MSSSLRISVGSPREYFNEERISRIAERIAMINQEMDHNKSYLMEEIDSRIGSLATKFENRFETNQQEIEIIEDQVNRLENLVGFLSSEQERQRDSISEAFQNFEAEWLRYLEIEMQEQGRKIESLFDTLENGAHSLMIQLQGVQSERIKSHQGYASIVNEELPQFIERLKLELEDAESARTNLKGLVEREILVMRKTFDKEMDNKQQAEDKVLEHMQEIKNRINELMEDFHEFKEKQEKHLTMLFNNVCKKIDDAFGQEESQE
mmetsp:Transcript_48071/g.55380  ORF Transcript_48071/g.55380 Transcript_48071/m.55380 type:complete len:264 (-) Transcript_48071:54-845(-)